VSRKRRRLAARRKRYCSRSCASRRQCTPYDRRENQSGCASRSRSFRKCDRGKTSFTGSQQIFFAGRPGSSAAMEIYSAASARSGSRQPVGSALRLPEERYGGFARAGHSVAFGESPRTYLGMLTKFFVGV
jgi:hypothetical protein